MLVSGHREFDYEELLTATLALQRGAMLFATSRDPTLPMPGGAWPGTGSILAAVETASGRRAEIGGKPERHLFELARERLGGAERVAMVGDRIASDIEGGRRAGLATDPRPQRRLHPRGGGEAAEPPPDHVVDDLAALLAVSAGAADEPAFRPGLAFAGIFAVTFCGLLAVGAVLPVLPRYVHGPLDGGNIAVGIVDRLLRGDRAAAAPDRRPLRRPPRPQADGSRRLDPRRRRRLPLPAAARRRRADRRPARARRRRGHGLHRRLGLDRRPRAARIAAAG